MQRFTVVYRVGGTERFTWRRTEPVAKAAAEAIRQSLDSAGYFTLAPQDYQRSLTIGLPETFEVAR